MQKSCGGGGGWFVTWYLYYHSHKFYGFIPPNVGAAVVVMSAIKVKIEDFNSRMLNAEITSMLTKL